MLSPGLHRMYLERQLRLGWKDQSCALYALHIDRKKEAICVSPPRMDEMRILLTIDTCKKFYSPLLQSVIWEHGTQIWILPFLVES